MRKKHRGLSTGAFYVALYMGKKLECQQKIEILLIKQKFSKNFSWTLAFLQTADLFPSWKL
mgnify:FL=1